MEKIISIKVTPRAKESLIIEDFENNLKIKVKSPPVDGRANQEILELLADYYKIPKSQIQIIQGSKSRNKLIKISGLSK